MFQILKIRENVQQHNLKKIRYYFIKHATAK